MIIITVGIDCSGKSTLIEKLAEELDYIILRGSSFELTAGKTNQELFDTFVGLTDVDNVVFDRFTYCNYCYAPLYDDYSVLTEEQVRFIERELKGEAIVIHLTADTETIKQRFETRGEEYVSVDKIDTIKSSYNEILANADLPVYTYNTSIISTEAIVEDIIDILNN